MAGAVNIELLLKELECSICLGTFVNPKELSCRHVFCKGCLDEVIEFNNDGEGTIKCGLCNEETTLGKIQTTNDLPSQLYVKNMVERLTPNRLEHAVRCGSETCENNCSIFCVDCGIFNCKTCENEHVYSYPGHKKEKICYNPDMSLNIECRRHMTACKSICCNNEMICIYCMHRRHSGHNFRSIEERVNSLKDAIEDEINRMESIPSLQKGNKENISETKREIMVCVQYRKYRSLYDYMLVLQRNEQRLLKEFELISEQHTEELNISNTPDVLREQLRLSDIQLALMTKDIVTSIGNDRCPLVLSSRTVSLSEYNFSNVDPLGQLITSVKEIAFDDAKDTPTFNFNNPDEEIASTLLETLQEMIRECLGSGNECISQDDGRQDEDGSGNKCTSQDVGRIDEDGSGNVCTSQDDGRLDEDGSGNVCTSQGEVRIDEDGSGNECTSQDEGREDESRWRYYRRRPKRPPTKNCSQTRRLRSQSSDDEGDHDCDQSDRERDRGDHNNSPLASTRKTFQGAIWAQVLAYRNIGINANPNNTDQAPT